MEMDMKASNRRLLAAFAVLAVLFVALAAVPMVADGSDADDVTTTAWVSSTGSDETGVLGDQNNPYKTVAKALTVKEVTKIVLSTDITESVTVEEGTSVVLDIGTHSLKAAASGASVSAITVEQGATLRITGSGSVGTTSDKVFPVVNRGTMVIESGQFALSSGQYAAVLNSGKLTVGTSTTGPSFVTAVDGAMVANEYVSVDQPGVLNIVKVTGEYKTNTDAKAVEALVNLPGEGYTTTATSFGTVNVSWTEWKDCIIDWASRTTSIGVDGTLIYKGTTFEFEGIDMYDGAVDYEKEIYGSFLAKDGDSKVTITGDAFTTMYATTADLVLNGTFTAEANSKSNSVIIGTGSDVSINSGGSLVFESGAFLTVSKDQKIILDGGSIEVQDLCWKYNGGEKNLSTKIGSEGKVIIGFGKTVSNGAVTDVSITGNGTATIADGTVFTLIPGAQLTLDADVSVVGDIVLCQTGDSSGNKAGEASTSSMTIAAGASYSGTVIQANYYWNNDAGTAWAKASADISDLVGAGSGFTITAGSIEFSGTYTSVESDDGTTITITSGEAKVTEDMTIPEGTKIVIASEATLTVESNKKLTNEGVIQNKGTVTVTGSIQNDGVIQSETSISDTNITGNAVVPYIINSNDLVYDGNPQYPSADISFNKSVWPTVYVISTQLVSGHATETEAGSYSAKVLVNYTDASGNQKTNYPIYFTWNIVPYTIQETDFLVPEKDYKGDVLLEEITVKSGLFVKDDMDITIGEPDYDNWNVKVTIAPKEGSTNLTGTIEKTVSLESWKAKITDFEGLYTPLTTDDVASGEGKWSEQGEIKAKYEAGIAELKAVHDASGLSNVFDTHKANLIGATKTVAENLIDGKYSTVEGEVSADGIFTVGSDEYTIPAGAYSTYTSNIASPASPSVVASAYDTAYGAKVQVFNVTFDLNGGTVDDPIAEQKVLKDGTATKPTTNPVKASDDSYAYEFKYWTTNLTTPETQTGYDFATRVTADITLHAYYASVDLKSAAKKILEDLYSEIGDNTAKITTESWKAEGGKIAKAYKDGTNAINAASGKAAIDAALANAKVALMDATKACAMAFLEPKDPKNGNSAVFDFTSESEHHIIPATNYATLLAKIENAVFGSEDESVLSTPDAVFKAYDDAVTSSTQVFWVKYDIGDDQTHKEFIVKEQYATGMDLQPTKAVDDTGGYEFVGWAESSGQIMGSKSVQITKDVTLYPAFASTGFSIVLKDSFFDDGEYVITKKVGDEYTLPVGPDALRSFVGWEMNGKVYASGYVITVGADLAGDDGRIVLTAVYKDTVRTDYSMEVVVSGGEATIAITSEQDGYGVFNADGNYYYVIAYTDADGERQKVYVPSDKIRAGTNAGSQTLSYDLSGVLGGTTVSIQFVIDYGTVADVLCEKLFKHTVSAGFDADAEKTAGAISGAGVTVTDVTEKTAYIVFETTKDQNGEECTLKCTTVDENGDEVVVYVEKATPTEAGKHVFYFTFRDDAAANPGAASAEYFNISEAYEPGAEYKLVVSIGGKAIAQSLFTVPEEDAGL